jgi:hypothetical protein
MLARYPLPVGGNNNNNQGNGSGNNNQGPPPNNGGGGNNNQGPPGNDGGNQGNSSGRQGLTHGSSSTRPTGLLAQLSSSSFRTANTPSNFINAKKRPLEILKDPTPSKLAITDVYAHVRTQMSANPLTAFYSNASQETDNATPQQMLLDPTTHDEGREEEEHMFIQTNTHRWENESYTS